ncbi:hypothetical protein [Micromonospora fulviviridis]|uniref:ABC transporter substrate-binding protein n=1 Tax=Micromonospora fulviviridis TaxID=47860 RepID=A0ABV2VQI6_9ACTN
MARHTLPLARTGTRPRAARLGMLPLLLLALLGPAACDDGGDTPTAGPAGVDADAGDDTTGGDAADPANSVRPPCPFTAAQVSDLLGQPMRDGTLTLSSIGTDVAGYERTLRRLLDAIPA